MISQKDPHTGPLSLNCLKNYWGLGNEGLLLGSK